ncbi:aspartate racemase [Aspergillus campestris IBT 28561]|uniref:Aspartate racemase n=1 Tax=Aspergillus campestris (strain IBT 28561) TaxID=1392248 RepID=A0A2I1CR75_ASPC2|nr:aspartate racemase [Aspergillus campestris IBT 28561]PKY00122.1 aspartate racemase [Aspergillus campestris IBT 28561]
MKTIGIIGGLSWPSTITYYQVINELVTGRLGGLRGPKIIVIQADLHQITEWRLSGQVDKIRQQFHKYITSLQSAGADFYLVACNTYQFAAEKLPVDIPMLHMADSLGRRINKEGYKRIGFLGSSTTLTGQFIIGPLRSKYGLDVLIPDAHQRVGLERVIMDELTKNIILPESREMFRQVIYSLVDQGAELIILGCTEIGLLVREEDSPVPVMDTSLVHAEDAVDKAMTLCREL